MVGLAVLSLAVLRPLPQASAVTGGGPGSGFGRVPAVGKIDLPTGNRCTGVMIAGDILLTARHCQTSIDTPVTFFEFGDSDETPVQGLVSGVMVHPTVDLTMAKIRFSTFPPTTVFPTPLGINYDRQPGGTPVTLVGYGLTDGGGIHLAKYQIQGVGQVESVLPHEFLVGISEYKFTGFGACGGDSGGPVIKDGQIIAILVRGDPTENEAGCSSTSFGLPLGDFKDWIESTSQQING